jgi:hypothetical protein
MTHDRVSVSAALQFNTKASEEGSKKKKPRPMAGRGFRDLGLPQ